MDHSSAGASADQFAAVVHLESSTDVYAETHAAARSDSLPSSPSANSRGTTPHHVNDAEGHKRRCISTACVACRKRKSKCDGALPSCAACASVYSTECVYRPNSDHRRRGVYRELLDSTKAQGSTLQIIVDALLNASGEDVDEVVSRIRTCNNLDSVAQEFQQQQQQRQQDTGARGDDDHDDRLKLESPGMSFLPVEGERDLAGKMGEFQLANGFRRFIGGTSHLLFLNNQSSESDFTLSLGLMPSNENPVTTWTRVTSDPYTIIFLLNMYFNYHYQLFTTMVPKLFWSDFMKGRAGQDACASYCSPLLVNAMLAIGCHFTDHPGAFGTAGDATTKGDHFFAEAKRLMMENFEYEKPCLATVQALALMSVREAGCARETQGWVYSGMSFRMALDLGLNLEVEEEEEEEEEEEGQYATDEEIDARRITFWGCFLFDKFWSNYLGRLPQLPRTCFTVAKPEVFPDEDAAPWSPLTDEGFDDSRAQPSRTRAIALQLSKLCEITSDLLFFFYHPSYINKPSSKALGLKKLGEIHQRLEEWRKFLPAELDAKEGAMPNVILLHAFFHLQYIHLFRPFLKYPPSASPLPSHISPRRMCTAKAGAISKLMRLYAKSWHLRQFCNIGVYMLHSACIIHLLDLPEKTARRDINHGLRHLEVIAENWRCARRSMSMLGDLADKWHCELPDEAALTLQRADDKHGRFSIPGLGSPEKSSFSALPPAVSPGASEGVGAAARRGSQAIESAPGPGPASKPAGPWMQPFGDQPGAQWAAYDIAHGAPLNDTSRAVLGGNVDQPRRGSAVDPVSADFADQPLDPLWVWAGARPLSMPPLDADADFDFDAIGPSVVEKTGSLPVTSIDDEGPSHARHAFCGPSYA